MNCIYIFQYVVLLHINKDNYIDNINNINKDNYISAAISVLL